MNKDLKPLLYETLIAQGIGDAFGYVVEFKNWEKIQQEYGVLGLKFSYINKMDTLYTTDDTQMNLFCLQGLVNELDKNDIVDPTKAIYDEYLCWLTTQGFRKKNDSRLNNYKELYFRRAPGKTCLSALGSNRCGTIENKINDSKGCGGIMRAIPTAFFAENIQDAFDWGAKQAAITHGHPSGYLSAGAYSAVAYQLIHNKDLSIVEAMENIKPILSSYSGSIEMINVLNYTIEKIKKDELLEHQELNKELGEGWVGEEAFALAMYFASKYEKFEDVIYYGSNHDGDSDSTAMLAAGIWHLKNRRSEEFLKYASKIDLEKCIRETVENIIEIEYVDEAATKPKIKLN